MFIVGIRRVLTNLWLFFRVVCNQSCSFLINNLARLIKCLKWEKSWMKQRNREILSWIWWTRVFLLLTKYRIYVSCRFFQLLKYYYNLYSIVTMLNLTRITLTHNRISVVTPALANLTNLEILNLFNNQVEELPTSLSSMPKLRILNLG